jgi:actin cytoskeleton-regulatory complex protein PAN1
VQRITRYPLLIRQVCLDLSSSGSDLMRYFQILQYTEVAQDRTLIEQSLQVAENILNHINESIREQEGRERLRTISKDLWVGQGWVISVEIRHTLTISLYSRLDLTAPSRNMGPRRLLKEGIVTKSKSGRRLRAFLCSDVLVLTDENAQSLYRMVRFASSFL